MKTYFLDTSIIIDYLRGKPIVVNQVNNLDGELTSSYVCLAEIFEGVFHSKEKEKAKEIAFSFFRGLSTVFGLDEKISEKFGEIRKQLKQQGKIIEDIDIFIAATCIVNNLTLVTLNKKHFFPIRELQIFS